jgi:aminoglycoside 6'-N-acetyltransferase I
LGVVTSLALRHTHRMTPIRPATAADLDQWAVLRIALWDWDSVEDHHEEAEELYLAGDPDRAAFVAVKGDRVLGFAEATLRRDYVEGCETSPIAFLEGVYVTPQTRKTGLARALADAVADWGRAQGCTEFASNALLDNVDSHAFHAAIGFAETERVIYFKRDL